MYLTQKIDFCINIKKGTIFNNIIEKAFLDLIQFRVQQYAIYEFMTFSAK